MILTLLLAVSSASALDLRWWGVGPTVGTMAVPGKYPSAFPAAVRTDTDETLVDKVGGDVEFGVHGVLYPGTAGRLFGNATLGLGTAAWVQPELVVGYDGILVKDEEFQLLFGGGLGAGHERFNDKDTGNFLRVNYFPVRAQLSAFLRDRSRAYELGIYATYHLVSSQEYCTADGAQCVDGKGEASVGGAFYGAIGAQATLYFGDFRNKNSGEKKKKGK